MRRKILTSAALGVCAAMLLAGCAGLDLDSLQRQASSLLEEADSALQNVDSSLLEDIEERVEAYAGGEDAEPADSEAGYTYTLADGVATVTGFENTVGDGLFAPPAQLGGAPVQAIGNGEGPLGGVAGIRSLDLSALSGYRVNRLAFAGSALENKIDLNGAAHIGASAFGDAAVVPQLAADDSLTVEQNAFAGAPYAVLNAGAGNAGGFAADADSLRPGLAELRVLVHTQNQLPSGVLAENDLWILAMHTGFYGLQVATATSPSVPDGTDAVSGAAYTVTVMDYSGLTGTAFASGEYPLALALTIPGYNADTTYFLSLGGAAADEGVTTDDDRALIALQSVAAGGTSIALYTQRATVPVSGISIQGLPQGNRLSYGDSVSLTAAVRPQDATNPALEWRTSDGSVLEINQSGELVARKTGRATITAAAQDGSAVSETAELEVVARTVRASGITARNRQYDGTRNATLTMDTLALDGKLSGDTLTLSATGTFSDERPGTGKAVALSGLTLGGASAGNYTLDASASQSSATANITKRDITISAPRLTTRKTYDGNATARVEAGTASGILSQDGAGVQVSASAAYDNAEVGSGKRITVTYRLGGNRADYYNAPATYTTNDGVITAQGAAVAPGAISAEDLVSHHGSSIVIKGTAGQQYALVADGNYGHYTGSGFTEGWLEPNADGQVTFGSLTANRSYQLVTRESYDEAHQSASIVSSPLEVMLYSDSQQKVLDELQALEGGVESGDDVNDVVALTQDYGALSAEERDTLDSQNRADEQLQDLQRQSGQLNHRDGNVTVGGDELPWYVKLTVTEADDSDSRWTQLQQAAGTKTLLEAADYALTDLLQNSSYQPSGGTQLLFSIPLPSAGAPVEVLRLDDGGAYTSISAQASGGALIFTADRPGFYAVVTETGAPITEPDTDEGGTPWGLIIGIIAGVLALAGAVTGVVVWRRRKNAAAK